VGGGFFSTDVKKYHNYDKIVLNNDNTLIAELTKRVKIYIQGVI
jgi:hypothetical protein